MCGLNGVYLVLYAVVSVAAFLIGLAFASSAGILFSSSFTLDEVELAQVVMSIMAGSIAITLFSSVFDAYVIAHEQFRFQQSRQLLTTLATPFCAYALLCFDFGVIGVAVAQLAVNTVLLALNANFCLGKLRMRFALRRSDSGLFKAIAVFSSWIFANQVCELLNQNVPNVVLGAFCGASTVAVFAIAMQLRQLFFSLSTTMSNVFVPLVNQIVAESNDNTELAHLMARVGRYQAILYLWALGGFAVLGRFFVERWAGSDFADAYWLVLVMATPLLVPLVQNTGIEIQRAKNMHRARSVCYLATAALNVAVTAALAAPFGYWAPAVGYAAHCVLGTGIFMNWYYHCRVGLNMAYFWHRVLPAVGAGVLATVVCLAGTTVFPVASWLEFAAWGLAYTALYVALCAAIVLDKGERAAVVSRARKILGR